MLIFEEKTTRTFFTYFQIVNKYQVLRLDLILFLTILVHDY